MPRLFVFGLGYSARVLARRLRAAGWEVVGTSRSVEGCRALEEQEGVLRCWPFDGTEPLPPTVFEGVSHLLSSVPPGEDGDPVLRHHADDIAAAGFAWVGYLSTTGVYGDRAGGWVDEDTPVDPDVPRSARRAHAERAWLRLAAPVHVFRLAGIYGPGRSAIDTVRSGKARRIVKPGQVFCRIHVEDIAATVEASIARPNPPRIYNVCDDEPAPPQDVIAHAAALLGVAPPPEVAFEDADLGPMARSFYADSRRVHNDRIKDELGVRLAYPTYREGLKGLL